MCPSQEINSAKAVFMDTGRSLAHKTNPMRRWIDEVSFRMRVVLLILVVVITIAVIAWDMIEF